MGSTEEFSAWLATNPIDLNVEKLNPTDIVKKDTNCLVNVATGIVDIVKENTTTKAMMDWMLQETTPETWNEQVRGRQKASGSERHHFRDDMLVLICGWQFCGLTFSDWTEFQEHVTSQHLEEVRQGLEGQEGLQCRWQGCRYGSARFTGHRRHLNIHCIQVS